MYIWYSTGGGADYIKIKKETSLEKIAELIGFYFGDGNTSANVRSFRLNNCEQSVLNYCLDILEDIGIRRDMVKVQVIYSTPYEKIGNSIKERCTSYWSEILGLKESQIVSINRSFGKTESLQYGSARIFLDNATFVELMLNGVLKRFIKFLKNPNSKEKRVILRGFLRGLAAAEGSVILTSLKSLSKVGFAYNPHSEDLDFYKLMLTNLGVNYAGINGNELYIYRMSNFKIFNDIDLFKMHETRKIKFNLGYQNHKFYNKSNIN